MASKHEEMDRGELGTYVASSYLYDLIRDLQERGVLEGPVRESVIASLNGFFEHRSGEPMDLWHADLVDLYEGLTGQVPEHRG